MSVVTLWVLLLYGSHNRGTPFPWLQTAMYVLSADEHSVLSVGVHVVASITDVFSGLWQMYQGLGFSIMSC